MPRTLAATSQLTRAVARRELRSGLHVPFTYWAAMLACFKSKEYTGCFVGLQFFAAGKWGGSPISPPLGSAPAH